MTVRELMEKLSALDPDSPMLIYDTGGEGLSHGYRDAHRAHVVRVAPRNTSGFYPRFINLPQRNTVAAVCVE